MNSPIACLLPGPEMRDRLTAIAELAKRALQSHDQDGRTLRLRYAGDAAEELERLVALERRCCAFLEFDLVRRPDAAHLLIGVHLISVQKVTVQTPSNGAGVRA